MLLLLLYYININNYYNIIKFYYYRSILIDLAIQIYQIYQIYRNYMHHLIEISLGQLLLQPPLVCFCCRVFLTMLEKGRWLPHRQKFLPLFTPLVICPVFCVDYEYAVGLCHTCVSFCIIFDLCTRGGRVPRHSCLVFYIINRIIKK